MTGGPSFFGEETPDGSSWVFREDTQGHRDYWLNYKLPVIVTLYDPSSHVAYWQHITPETAKITGKGFKVLVPKSQRIDEAAEEVLTALAGRLAANGFAEAFAATALRLRRSPSPSGRAGSNADATVGP